MPKSTVERSPFFQEIRDCLASGWSPQATRDWVIKGHPQAVVPKDDAIRRWRDKHQEEKHVIPHEVIRKKLEGVDYKVDLMMLLSRIIPLLEDRVCHGLEMEATMGGILLGPVDEAVSSYLSALEAWKKTAQDLGLVPVVLRGPPIDARTQNLNVYDSQTVRELTDYAKELLERRRAQEAITGG